ncbi:LINE-1 reverse transcriptase [Chionoecetes opilio]|uniref:LINE-1 reverse transcriptase n=1 Tax=Chionoecetes opilio TaxID=41210 RepID=A0A8J4Y3J7_CHIOP|nr:LINE-1 reverse transcriptase [Chionoecetes opilio]
MNKVLVGCFVCGISGLAWMALFLLCNQCLSYFFRAKKWSISVHHTMNMSEAIVSSLQAVLSSVCGIVVVAACRHDVIKAVHPLASWYAWVAASYFIYDTIAMYKVHVASLTEVPKCLADRISSYLRRRTLLAIHHILVTVFLMPVLVYRSGVGDFFVGCFYCVELSGPFTNMRVVLSRLGFKTSRTLLRRDKERCVRSLAEDVEGHLNANDLRPAYRALKKLRSKSPSRASAIRTADGRLVSDMDGQMARWAEYFGQLFTVDPPTEQLHTTGLQAVDADPPIDETAPSLDEVREAVAKLKGGKAADVCNISAELLKAGGEAMIRGLHAVLTAVWQSGTIPPDWKRRLVVPIWKGKGDSQDCNNYRGITLLSVPGKVLAHLLLTRIRSHLVKHQRPQQSGFMPGKSTTDRILALRVLVERRREFRQGMLAAYVDLKKAFDSVHRESLWDLLRLRGIPARTIGLITGLYSGTESAVKCGAGVSSFFPVNTGVRQGCVLAPSLFNACMDWVLDKVVDQSDCGASVGNTKITDLVFADDVVIFAESLEVLVMALEALHEEAKPLGLEVSWLKTKVQVFGDLLDEAVQSVHACDEDIEILESFTYLGSAVHNDGGSRQEVLRRIGIAHGVMDSLSGSIWRCRYLCRRTKIRIFKSLVIPVLLYGCETWTLNSDLKRRINAFGNKCLRRIMGLYAMNGFLMIVTFALCRVAIFPYMYLAYGEQYGLDIIQVAKKIPIHCNLGSLLVLLPQIHWLRLMVVGAFKVSQGVTLTEADEKID